MEFESFAIAFSRYRRSHKLPGGAKIISQTEMGEMVGVDLHSISGWETGKTFPQKRHWRKITFITGIDPEPFYKKWLGKCRKVRKERNSA